MTATSGSAATVGADAAGITPPKMSAIARKILGQERISNLDRKGCDSGKSDVQFVVKQDAAESRGVAEKSGWVPQGGELNRHVRIPLYAGHIIAFPNAELTEFFLGAIDNLCPNV
jgi:hypothetical protein